MIQGLKKEYLDSIGGSIHEKVVCRDVRQIYSKLNQETQRWSSLWKTILQYSYPTLDNIYQEGTANLIKSNEVYSSDHSVLIRDYVQFLLKSMYPETMPWIKNRFVTHTGIPIPRSEVDSQALQYADMAISAMRYWLKVGGFYEQAEGNLNHDTLLGNSAMQAVASWDEISFIDVPISRLAIGRDSVGRVDTVGEVFAFEDWEIVKKFGKDALPLFRKPRQDNRISPREFVAPRWPMAGQNRGAPESAGAGAGQTVGFNAPYGQASKEFSRLIKLFTPNRPWSRLPNNPNFYPEMEYVVFNVTEDTGRLVDVEVHPVLPLGISKDIGVNGELYGRGLGNLLLPDISVLNSKKKIELRAEGIQSQSPIVMKGKGFQKPPQGNSLRPYQLLHVHRDTEMAPLYQRSPLTNNAHSSYDKELESLARGLRKDKIEVALADRMTAEEYTQRKDSSWGLFSGLAGRHYKQVAHPCLNALFSWLIMTEKLPPMPLSLVEGTVRFNIETYSVFSYGSESEVGQNLMRAFGPLMGLIESQPQLLDVLDSEKFLRANLSRFELSRFVRSEDSVSDVRQRRMEELLAQRQDPVEKAQGKYLEEETRKSLTESGGEGYLAL